MKKIFFTLLIVFQSIIAVAQNCCDNDTISKKEAAASFIEHFPIIEHKIRQLYENEVFGNIKDPNFKISHICTADFLQRLENANDFDTKGYATWLLRSGMQDGDDTLSKVLSITPGNNNTVIVNWSDMGHEGSTTFTLIESDGEWKIDNATVPDGYKDMVFERSLTK